MKDRVDEIKDKLLNQPLTAQVAVDAAALITELRDEVESLKDRYYYS